MIAACRRPTVVGSLCSNVQANGGEEETFEFSFEDQNQFDAAYLTQILDLEAQVEELSAQLEQQSIVMEDMKSDLAYYR